MKGFFTIHNHDGYRKTVETDVRAADVSSITYGNSDSYRGIAGISITLRNGEVLESTDEAEYVKARFREALQDRE